MARRTRRTRRSKRANRNSDSAIVALEEKIARMQARRDALADPNYAAVRQLKRLGAKLQEAGCDLPILSKIEAL